MWICQNLPFLAVLENFSTPLHKTGDILCRLCDLVYQIATIDNLLNYFYCINNPESFISQYFKVSRLFPSNLTRKSSARARTVPVLPSSGPSEWSWGVGIALTLWPRKARGKLGEERDGPGILTLAWDRGTVTCSSQLYHELMWDWAKLGKAEQATC